MIRIKEKYRLMWIDAYLLDDNWETIDNIKEFFPVSDYSIAGDGWVDCSHCYKFESSNIEEVKKIVNKYIDNTGRNIDVFSVLNSENKTILTEQDR